MQTKWRGAAAAAWVAQRPLLLLAGAVFTEALMLGVAAVTRSLAAGVTIGGMAVLLMGYINLIMLLYRDQPLVPRDMVMALNLRQLTTMISPLFACALAAVTLFAAGLFFLLQHLLPAVEWPPVLRTRVIAGCVLLLFTFLSLYFKYNPLRSLLQAAGEKGADFFTSHTDVYRSYRRNGFLLAFCSQIGMPMMSRPTDYSREAVENCVREYREAADRYNAGLVREERPDIVFVMSESFSDPTRLPGLHLGEDPIPALRARMADTLSGQVLAPGYGGGTAHCEFEALTGFSIALCGGASPFESVVAKRERFPALPRTLREAGYRTVALHPYTDTMYARPGAYRAMGFDDFVIQSGMRHTDKLENNPYISDEAAYREAMDILEESGPPCFIHLVTMQNHGEYPSGRYQDTIPVQGLAGRKGHCFLETYARGLRYTDRATDEFLRRLRERKRPTMVVFWGDHLPGGYPEEFLEQCGRKKFETPFFLWTPRPVEPVELGGYSPLFFRTLLHKACRMPKTPFDLLLEELESEVHGIHMEFFVDGKGNPCEAPKGTGGPLALYQLMQYDAVEGEGIAEQAGFYSYRTTPEKREKEAASP